MKILFFYLFIHLHIFEENEYIFPVQNQMISLCLFLCLSLFFLFWSLKISNWMCKESDIVMNNYCDKSFSFSNQRKHRLFPKYGYLQYNRAHPIPNMSSHILVVEEDLKKKRRTKKTFYDSHVLDEPKNQPNFGTKKVFGSKKKGYEGIKECIIHGRYEQQSHIQERNKESKKQVTLQKWIKRIK